MGSESFKVEKSASLFESIESGIFSALETYSNVHRGSGHHSMVTTYLYDQAREIVLDYLGLSRSKYVVIFCSSRGAEVLKKQIRSEKLRSVTSNEIGLALGVTALASERNALRDNIRFWRGGGTARLMSVDWIVWSRVPERFEAGTPAIINIIAFAKALSILKISGADFFKNQIRVLSTVDDIFYHDELEKLSGSELLNELRKMLIGLNSSVPTTDGIRPFINLDNGASTPTFLPVWNAFRSAVSVPDEIQKDIIKEARSLCSKTTGAPEIDYDIIFTSNTTEAINLVSENLFKYTENTVVINSLMEHSSNELPWRTSDPSSLKRLMVDSEGFISIVELEKLLSDYNRDELYGKKRVRLVAVSGASNVLGSCNDLAEICRVAHKYGACMLVDAAQLVAHRKVEIEKWGIDYLAFSAHKAYAPFGTGVLIARKGLLSFDSSEMDEIRSSGEQNIGGIAALGKSLVLLNRIGLDIIREEEKALTEYALESLTQIKSIKVFGVSDPQSEALNRKSGVIVFGLGSMMANSVAKKLAEQGGIGVRYGCHCAHIIVKRLVNIPPFLEKFQRLLVTLFPKMLLPGVVRISFGIENTKKDIDSLIRQLKRIENKYTPVENKNISGQINEYVLSISNKVYAGSPKNNPDR